MPKECLPKPGALALSVIRASHFVLFRSPARTSTRIDPITTQAGHPLFRSITSSAPHCAHAAMAAEHGEAEMCFARLTSKDGTETAVNLDLVELMKADGTGTRLFFPGSEDGLFVRESTADILEKVSSHVV